MWFCFIFSASNRATTATDKYVSMHYLLDVIAGNTCPRSIARKPSFVVTITQCYNFREGKSTLVCGDSADRRHEPVGVLYATVHEHLKG